MTNAITHTPLENPVGSKPWNVGSIRQTIPLHKALTVSQEGDEGFLTSIPYFEERHDECYEIARLIAAAPNLLEALHEAYEDIPGWTDKARAALAKARGQ